MEHKAISASVGSSWEAQQAGFCEPPLTPWRAASPPRGDVGKRMPCRQHKEFLLLLVFQFVHILLSFALVAVALCIKISIPFPPGSGVLWRSLVFAVFIEVGVQPLAAVLSIIKCHLWSPPATGGPREALWPVPERLEETGSLGSTRPGADKMRDGGLITSDPGLLVVSYRSRTSAPMSSI